MKHQVSKLTAISRRDLTPGQQAVQASHAAIDFCFKNQEISRNWHINSNYLIFLSVKDEDELRLLSQKLRDKEILFTEFYEPDLDNQLTAIAIEPHPVLKKYVSGFPLMLKIKKESENEKS